MSWNDLVLVQYYRCSKCRIIWNRGKCILFQCNKRLWDESNECFYSRHLKTRDKSDLTPGARSEAVCKWALLTAEQPAILAISHEIKVFNESRIQLWGERPGQAAYTCYLNWDQFLRRCEKHADICTRGGSIKQCNYLSTNTMIALFSQMKFKS